MDTKPSLKPRGIALSDELYTQLKVVCAERKIKIKDAVSAAIESWIRQSPKKQ